MTNHPNRKALQRFYLVKDDNSCSIVDSKAVLSVDLGSVMRVVETFEYYGPIGSGRTAAMAIGEAKARLAILNYP